MSWSKVGSGGGILAWLRHEWLVLASLVMLVAVAAGGIGYFRQAASPDSPALFGNDYLAFYAAGRMALEGHAAAAYDHAAHATEQQQLAAEAKGSGALPATYYFGYPPTYLALVAPFATLPYYASLFAFLGLTALLYLAAMWLIWPGWRTVILALAVPNACIAFGFGQNAFLTAGLVGCALALLDRRPWLAGILIGLLAVKPQLGLAFPFVLIATGRWRPLVAATATVVVTALLSAAVLGVDAWRAFLGIGGASRSQLLESSAVGFEKIQSLFAALRLAGASIPVAYVAQAVLALLVAGSLVMLWRSAADYRLKAAAAAGATLLTTPFCLAYDLMIEVPAAAFFAAYGAARGFRPGELAALALVLLTPEVAALGLLGTTPVGLFGMVVLYALVIARAFADVSLSRQPASAPAPLHLDPRHASG